MKFSAVVLVAAFFACAHASLLPFNLRQATPEDAIGTFERAGFFGGRCVKTIKHTATVNDEGVVPHDVMTHDGVACGDGGSMSVLESSEAATNMASNSEAKTLIQQVSASGETVIYAIEKEGRVCGNKLRLGKNTIVIFITPSKRLRIGLLPLGPGFRYMIVDDPEVDSICFYKVARRDENATPEPVETTEAPTAAGPTTAGPENTEPAATGAGEGPDGTDGPGTGVAPVPVPVPGGGSGGEEPAASQPPLAPEEGAGEGETTVEPTEDGIDSVDGEVSVSPTDDDGSVCFPGDASVELEDGTTKTMAEIQIGDRVRVSGNTFSDVFMFTHKDSTTSHEFVRLTTQSGESISATRGHYLYIDGRFAAASTAKVGSTVELGNGAITTVSDVAIVKGTGLFNPQTVHGDIIVNGVRASTFTTTIEPPTAQALLAPLRMMFDVFGLSSSVFDNGADQVAAVLPQGQLTL